MTVILKILITELTKKIYYNNNIPPYYNFIIFFCFRDLFGVIDNIFVNQNQKARVQLIKRIGISVELADSGNVCFPAWIRMVSKNIIIDFRWWWSKYLLILILLTNKAVQHERGPRTSTVRRQLQGLCYSKDRSASNSPPLDLTPKRSPECSTTCSTPPGRYIPDSNLYLSAFRPQVN